MRLMGKCSILGGGRHQFKEFGRVACEGQWFRRLCTEDLSQRSEEDRYRRLLFKLRQDPFHAGMGA